MKAIGGHTGAIAQIAKGNANQAGSIAIHTQGLHALSTLVAEAFRANVSEGKTRAKPEIWSDWSGFESKAGDLKAAAAALAAAGDDVAAVGGKLKALFGSCKGCHQDYRKKKQ